MNPEIYALSLIEWQLFATLTFKSEKLSEAVRIKMFFALMRRQADNFGVHFSKTIWCLRTERGEATARIHHHAMPPPSCSQIFMKEKQVALVNACWGNPAIRAWWWMRAVASPRSVRRHQIVLEK